MSMAAGRTTSMARTAHVPPASRMKKHSSAPQLGAICSLAMPMALARSMPHLRQWHVGPNALLLDGRAVRDGAVRGGAGDRLWPPCPPEARPPAPIERRLGL